TSNSDGSNLFQVAPFSFGVAVKQDWAPDGQHLVFTKNGIGHPPGVSANIATIRPDGTHLRLITHYEGGDVQALVGSYSPDGRWIVFRLEDHGLSALYKMHPEGSHLRVILPLSSFKPRVIDWGAKPSEAEESEAEEEVNDGVNFEGWEAHPRCEQTQERRVYEIENVDLSNRNDVIRRAGAAGSA